MDARRQMQQVEFAELQDEFALTEEGFCDEVDGDGEVGVDGGVGVRGGMDWARIERCVWSGGGFAGFAGVGGSVG